MTNTSGSNNVFIGYQSGQANTTSNNNCFVGYQAGLSNTGNSNSFVGTYAGYTNGASNANSFFGYASGFYNASGIDNTYIGHTSGYHTTSGDYNTCTGLQSGYNLTTGSQNTFLGLNAGYANSTGSYNIAVGRNAGDSYATESNCTFIGYGADANANSYSNSTAIGNGAITTGSNDIVLGNASITSLRCQVGITPLSDRRIKDNIQENVPGLEFINLLKPVTYNFNVDHENQILGIDTNQATDSSGHSLAPPAAGKYDIEQIQFTGFIAQAVDSAAQQIGYNFSGVYKPQNEATDLYGLRYTDFIPPLVKAVQELSHQVDSLKGVLSSSASGQRYSNTPVDSISALPSQSVTLSSRHAILYQNTPNPAGDQTGINYFLPEEAVNAEMVFYDMYGNEIKRIALENKGNAVLNVNTQDLNAGIYTYSLIVNGRVVDTLKMVRAHQ